jgi:hypothetical protein
MLLAELERVGARTRLLEEEAVQLRAENHKLRLENDRLLAESTRGGLAGRKSRSPTAGDPGELRELKERARSLERDQRSTLLDAVALKKRLDGLEAELRKVREDATLGAEERTCLEEQLEQLTHLINLLTAENRVLRRDRERDGRRRP